MASFRSRLHVPLEYLTILIFLASWVFPVAFWGKDPPPFKLCGVVYAKPDKLVYASLAIPLIFSFVIKPFEIIARCARHTKGDCAFIMRAESFQHGLAVLHSSRLSITEPVFVIFILSIFMWFFSFLLPATLGFLGIQLLNVAIQTTPTEDKEHELRPNAFVRFITVLATDSEYRNMDLGKKDWNPIEIEESADIPCRAYRDGKNYAIFHINDSKYEIVVPGTGDVAYGYKGEDGSRSSSRSYYPDKYYRVDRDMNFRLIKMNVPYALIWYSVYQTILVSGGFRGAEEIDKCIIWLLLVSVVSEIIVRYLPGPAVVVQD